MAIQRIYYYAYRGTTGLTDAKIDIYLASVKVVDQETMTEVGSGLYYYDFVTTTAGNYIAQMNSATYPTLSNYNFTITVTSNTSPTTTSSLLYCSVTDIYNSTGLDSTKIDANAIIDFIKSAEKEVDRFVNNTFWAEQDNGTATSGTTGSLTDTSKSWATNEYTTNYIWVYSGTGKDQVRQIDSNTGTSISVIDLFDTAPDNTSKYRLIHTGNDPYEEYLDDGDGTNTLFLSKYPVQALRFVSSAGVTVTTTNIYQYPKIGKLILKNNAEMTYWSDAYPQEVNVKYYYGVYPILGEIKRLTIVTAALMALSSYIGTTFGDITSYSIPDFTATKGVYTNIREAFNVLSNELKMLQESVIKYRSIF